MCVCVCVGGGGGQPLRTAASHHKNKSSKQFLRIAYLETSELKGSKRTLFILFLKMKSQMGQTENRSSKKLH